MTTFQFQSAPNVEVPYQMLFGAIDPGANKTAAGAPYSLKPGVGADFVARSPALPAQTLASAVVPRDGTITRLSAQHTIAGGAAIDVTYTLFIDGVSTGQFVQIVANVASPVVGSLATNIPVNQGQRVEVLVTLSGDLADPPAGIFVAVDLS